MEEDKFWEPNCSLFGDINQYDPIDEENNIKDDYNDEDAYFEEERIKSIHGDSGFDDLAPQSIFDEYKPNEDLLLKNNSVFKRLFSEGATVEQAIEELEELNPQAQDVLNFFNKNTKEKGCKM